MARLGRQNKTTQRKRRRAIVWPRCKCTIYRRVCHAWDYYWRGCLTCIANQISCEKTDVFVMVERAAGNGIMRANRRANSTTSPNVLTCCIYADYVPPTRRFYFFVGNGSISSRASWCYCDYRSLGINVYGFREIGASVH